MISVASTLLLVSLLFSGVSAAPVGTRSMDVKTMRRMAETPARRDTTTTVPVPRTNVPPPKANDDATHVHRKVLPRHVRGAVPRGRAVDTETKEKRAPEPTPEAEKTPTPRDPVDNVARADPDRAKKFAMRSEPAQKKKPVGKVVKRDPELVVRSTGDKIVKRDGGNDASKKVKRDPELVVKRSTAAAPHTPRDNEDVTSTKPVVKPRKEEERPKSLYASGASAKPPREVKEEEKKKRDDVRGPIGPIAMFRRTLENLD